jgi:hypothetical protein
MVNTMAIEGADAREIGFVEDFSLADNRVDALKQLIPGSADYYYYHCLHAQNNRDDKKVKELVKQWIKRHGYTGKVKEILNRQVLLEYERHPGKSLEHTSLKICSDGVTAALTSIAAPPSSPTTIKVLRIWPAILSGPVFHKSA